MTKSKGPHEVKAGAEESKTGTAPSSSQDRRETYKRHHSHKVLPPMSSELQHKPSEGTNTQPGLESLTAAAGLSILFLDQGLCLQRYSPSRGGLFSIGPADVGRPISGLKHRLHYEDIAVDAAQVLQTLIPVERQLQDAEGRSYIARVHPYETLEKEACGVVVILVQVTTLPRDYMAERKQAEDQLRELSQRLTYHVENSPLAVIEWGPDMRLIRWSAAAERMFGWKAEEVLGKRMEDFRWIYTDDIPEVKNLSKDLRTGSTPARFSANRNYRKDGKVIDCEWYNSSLVDGAGQLRSILSLVLEVTDRKQAEESLRESRQKYQDLIETTGDFIWEMDSEGRFTYCSPQMKDLWGMEPKDMVGRSPFDAILPEDKESGLKTFRELASAAAPMKSLTGTARNSRGELIIVETSGVPFFDQSGKLLGYRGITRDITERKRVERQLEESNQRLNEILGSIQDDFYVLDRQWTFIYASRLFTAKVGKEPEDFVGNNIWQMFPKHLGTVFEENLRATMEKREVRRFEVGGKYTPAWYRMTSFPSAEGITVLGTEITAQKKAEEALLENQTQLAKLNETLEQRVLEQTAELRRLASELTKAEHRERYRISHILHDDLQQRLYAIQMQMEFLRQGYRIEDDELQRELAEIKEQLAEILAVTRHLSIDLSPPVLSDEGLAQAIRWLAAQMREQHGLQIEIEAPGPFALHDEAMQVLLFNCVRELLFNVVKHAGVKQARVALQWLEDGLQIEVSDHGTGFSAGGPQVSGTALEAREPDPRASFGLPMISHRLSLFGGRMLIKSAPGAGAHVILTIPLEEKRLEK